MARRYRYIRNIIRTSHTGGIIVIDGIGVLVNLYVSSYITVPRSYFLSRLPDAIYSGIYLRRLTFILTSGLLSTRGPSSLISDSRG